MGFTKASYSPNISKLSLESKETPLLSSVVPQWIPGALHLLESSDLSPIYRELHYVLMEGVLRGWNCMMIDGANRFNPQYVDDFASAHNVSSEFLLKQLWLARPFQIFQFVDLVSKAHHRFQSSSHNLLLVTGLSKTFSESSDSDDNSTEFFLQIIGKLRQIAGSGNIVLVTKQESNPLDRHLLATAKVHLRFDFGSSRYWRGELLSHPSNSSTSVTRSHPPSRPKRSLHQLTLDDFFR